MGTTIKMSKENKKDLIKTHHITLLSSLLESIVLKNTIAFFYLKLSKKKWTLKILTRPLFYNF